LIFVLTMLLFLPLLQYYTLLALNPQFVQFAEPRGAALKVLVGVDSCAEEQGALFKILASLHEFYQSGI